MLTRSIFAPIGVLLFLTTISLPARSQTTVSDISSIITSLDSLRSRLPSEKLYIQFDKPYYSISDTIWMKAYLFDAAFLHASKSGIIYLELANDTNKVLMRRMMQVRDGLGWGNLVLDKEEVPEGSYTIRAYTNLMRNFNEERVFKKSFYVSSGSAESWLVNSKVSLTNQANKDNLHLDIQFNKLSKESIGLHNMELRVRDGRRVLLRDKVQTDVEGKLDLNFNLPEKVDPLNISLIVGDLAKGTDDYKITIPLVVNRPENTDLQFMPEGGNLVSGISSVIGFKAIGEDGKGTTISGKIYAGNNEDVITFNSSYKGMGSFELTPKDGEKYTAKIILNGIEKTFPLPPVKNTGTVLRVMNQTESDSIEVKLSSNLPPAATTAAYYLTAQARGVICYGAVIRFNGSKTITKKVAKSLFPTGITRFTLLDANRQPLNERIIFLDHQDNLNIHITSNKVFYRTRDSVALTIEVKDHQGNPVQGSFSIAVTDDSQIKMDSLSSNILTSVLLTSDLKGTIEGPEYYFLKRQQNQRDLDNLLLTQGWTGYDWKDIFNPPVSKFVAEPEFQVTGKVTNVFNNPVPSTNIQLVSTKPGFVMNSLTENNGSFTFSDFPVADSLIFFLQTKNKKNKSFNVGISIDEFKPPIFKTAGERIMPWYVNSDTSLLNYIKAGVEKKQEELKLSGNVLNEVTITAKKIIKYSHNLNGAGESDQAIEEKEILKAGKVTLGDIVRKRILGLRVKQGPIPIYLIQGLVTHLIIDGIDIEYSELGKILEPPATDLDEYFNNIDTEEITGIEIMTSPKYQFRYANAYFPPKIASSPGAVPGRHAWIEVTTRGGKGPFVHKGTGIFVYRPLPFTASKQFYSPKYTIKSPLIITDLRSTIYWEPDLITDKNGKATISFYTADRSGVYGATIEGSDMNGNIGRKTSSVKLLLLNNIH